MMNVRAPTEMKSRQNDILIHFSWFLIYAPLTPFVDERSSNWTCKS